MVITETPMVIAEAPKSGFDVHTAPLRVAALLMGAGAVLSFVGFVLALIEAMSQGQRLVNQMETPPNEMARSKVNQMMAAANAGANAWKEFEPANGHAPR